MNPVTRGLDCENFEVLLGNLQKPGNGYRYIGVVLVTNEQQKLA